MLIQKAQTIKSTLLSIFILSCLVNIRFCYANEFPVLLVTKESNQVILIGSNHLRGAPLEPNIRFINLVKSKKSFCFEFDENDKDAVKKSRDYIFENDSKIKLDKRFNTETYNRIIRNLDKFIPDVEVINAMSPFIVYLFLGNLNQELKKFNNKMSPKNSVDNYLKAIAKENNILTTGLEEPYAMLKAISNVSNSDWQDFINSYISMLECKDCVSNYLEMNKKMYESNGDPQHAYQYQMKSYAMNQKLGELIEKFLITSRNPEMAAKIENDALVGGKCDVVAIGAAHLGGENGVLNLLKKRGLTVEEIRN